ncbi:hypothetical protein GQ43DRAFT_469933 [Delitschia confertaspora ATCC 74209]|uniref:Rhodopsin domain-containing protein n=1 Tax=Delitschia confertaspora ATCC 74209 TaxID=1513339 RepID=A0A9P4N170_9PLEO|nr:hypothetical protein GQ43DRAFT_469933 [Delitschia confertaspora ATCC 74209]
MEARHLEDEEAYQNSTTITSSVLTALSVIVILLRLITRKFIIKRFGADDWMMVVSLIILIGFIIGIWIAEGQGMGYHNPNWPLYERIALLKTAVALEVIYYAVVFTIKISILCFYLRIAVERNFELACKLTIVYLFVFKTAVILTTLLQCIPLSDLWDFDNSVHGRCINTTVFHYFASSMSIATDIWILVMPIKMLVGVHRQKRDQAALSFVFGVGIFSCCAAIVRLHALYKFTESRDPAYDLVPINTWSVVEANMGVYCASIPTLRPLISKSQRERTRRMKNTYRTSDNSGSGSGTVASRKNSKTAAGETSDCPRIPSTGSRDLYGMQPIGEPPHALTRPTSLGDVMLDGCDEGSQERMIPDRPEQQV